MVTLLRQPKKGIQSRRLKSITKVELKAHLGKIPTPMNILSQWTIPRI